MAVEKQNRGAPLSYELRRGRPDANTQAVATASAGAPADDNTPWRQQPCRRSACRQQIIPDKSGALDKRAVATASAGALADKILHPGALGRTERSKQQLSSSCKTVARGALRGHTNVRIRLAILKKIGAHHHHHHHRVDYYQCRSVIIIITA